MNTLKDKINQIISEYRVENHIQIKAEVENLIKKHSKNVKLFEVLAIVFAQNGRIEDAILIFTQILNQEPKSIDTLINISLAYSEKNKIDKALEYLEKAKKVNIKQTEVYFNIGLIYEKKQIWNKAISNYEKAIKYNSKNINALINLGNLFLQNQDYKKAKDNYENAVKVKPNDPDLYHNLGVVFTKLNKIDKSIKCYSKSIKLKTKNALTFYNLGILYVKNYEYDLEKINEAKSLFIKAIKINNTKDVIYYNLAWIQTKIGNYESAINNYEKAIKINPNYRQAIYNLSRLFLTLENFTEGWPLYDKIRKNKFSENASYQKKLKDILKLPKWNKKKFSGKLFLYGEQGIGDQIVFSSMIPDLSKKHKNIHLMVEDRLVTLFSRSFPMIKVTNYNHKIKSSHNDCHFPLFSLGSVLRKSINNFNPKSFIIPDPKKINYYKKILSKNKKIKVGISWKTASDFSENKNISLIKLTKILSLNNFEFINLQYGNTVKEREIIKSKYGIKINNINNLDLKNDIEGLAALINCCDLVITITNATAQLAGSIGVPTWIMLYIFPHWEWFTKRNNSLWYPNVKLFRQKKYGNWDSVIESVYTELKKKY